IVVVFPCGPAGGGRLSGLFVAQQLFAGLVHADQRLFVRVRGGVDVEDVFHLRDEACLVPVGNAPALLPPRLQLVFLSVFRTVSAQTLVTSPWRLSSSASRVSVHRARPSGAGPQQVAIKWASARPSILGGTAGVSRTLRSRPAASPSS